ncbi:clotting factor B-like isoform X2 [Limulus polyphemus]|uniref:Clotting factor B-like isoform X2 n=1 Tax=Limulus polyphemus TaxID=6850 RepID=A0ABM1B858_LIMPO|nr:clotting factor B-like isoform X2 [Limulus polyphemus]
MKFQVIFLRSIHALVLLQDTSQVNFSFCQTTDGEDGICVRESYCRTLRASSTKQMCNEIRGVREVCCPFTLKPSTESTQPPTTPPPPSSLPTQISPHKKSEQLRKYEYLNEEFCGPVTSAYVGGNDTSVSYWPWMAAIFRKFTFSKRFLCGGTLVNTRYILSAAHCFVDHNRKIPAKFLFVRLESSKLDLSLVSESDYNVAEVMVHENYDSQRYYNDIALLRLTENTHHGTPVCWPTPTILGSADISPGTFATGTGWGDLAFGGRSPEVLQEAHIPIVSNIDCKAAYRNFNAKALPHGITEQFICAGYEKGGVDACQRDSGGPLVVSGNGGYAVVGIVSFGYMCGEPGFPGVYTRVSHFLPWIEKTLNTM